MNDFWKYYLLSNLVKFLSLFLVFFVIMVSMFIFLYLATINPIIAFIFVFVMCIFGVGVYSYVEYRNDMKYGKKFDLNYRKNNL